VRHVHQINPTVSCCVPHALHMPYVIQWVSNHAMRQVHQVPEKYSEPIYSLQSTIGMTHLGKSHISLSTTGYSPNADILFYMQFLYK